MEKTLNISDNTGGTPIINYTPQEIDEYIVIVNLPEDWEEVHNYIINENEIDGIPNRKINCSNNQSFSLRTAIYEMSAEEAEILKTHSKVENVGLNPDKYPQPVTLDIARFGNSVQFNKPLMGQTKGNLMTSLGYTPSNGTTNNVRSNWALLFANNPSSKPFKGGGIIPTDAIDRDVQYALKGNNVDAVILDSGVSVLHPEFIGSGGEYRVRDVILDGPYKIDPDFFDADSSNRLETVTIDGVNIGTRAKESVARAWWSTERANYAGHGYTIKITDASNSSNFKTFTITSNDGVYFGFRQDFSINSTPVASGGTLDLDPNTDYAVNIEFTRTGSGTWNSVASYGPFSYDVTDGNETDPGSGKISFYNIGSSLIYLNPTDKNGTDRSSVFNSSAPYNIDVVSAVTNGTRSAKFVNSSVTGGSHSGEFGKINGMPSTYTRIHAHSKNGTNAIDDNHGTACASQIGGKHHGFAFECNLWNIRILGDTVIVSASSALNICALWHKGKKVASNDPDPTVINNSYGITLQTSNDSGTTYYHTFRGSNATYVGTGDNNDPPSGHGSCRCDTKFTFKIIKSDGTTEGVYRAPGTPGVYRDANQQYSSTSASNSAAENAIAAGCIVLASAGNTNQKLSDKDDVDFDNKYFHKDEDRTKAEGSFVRNGQTISYNILGGAFINRVGGVTQGFSGDHLIGKGTIRVGAIDCGVEPPSEKQGVPVNTIRKTSYSANGPMVDIYSPADSTMAAAYASGEDYARDDNSNFYDFFFSGTSSATPNCVGVVCLFLEKNRSSDQNGVRAFLKNEGCKTGLLSDPITGVNATGYFTVDNTFTFDSPINSQKNTVESYNVRGAGNLRGSANRVLFNSLSSPINDNSLILKISGGSLNISGTVNLNSMNL